MPIYRAEKTKDFTIMSNAHLRDGRLSLKAKGLLSYMLSLPDDWRFSTRGLKANCREGADAVRKALCELEAAGYLRRTRIRSENGSFAEGEWSIYEKTGGVFPGLPQTENPQRDKPITGSADTENPTLLNTNIKKY